MAVTTGTFVLYESWLDYMVEGANMGSDVFKLLLTTSSYTPVAGTHSTISDITNELSGNGYAQQTLANQASGESGGTYTFDADDCVYTASGGSLVARYWVLYDDTLAGDPLVCYGLLDVTPADVTATDGNDITVEWNASGIFTIS